MYNEYSSKTLITSGMQSKPKPEPVFNRQHIHFLLAMFYLWQSIADTEWNKMIERTHTHTQTHTHINNTNNTTSKNRLRTEELCRNVHKPLNLSLFALFRNFTVLYALGLYALSFIVYVTFIRPFQLFSNSKLRSLINSAIRARILHFIFTS